MSNETAAQEAKPRTKAPENPVVFKDVMIVRSGDKIILPEGMSYAEGRTWLSRQEEAEMKTVAIHDEIPCFPLDGVVALTRALKEVYGFAALADTPGFFGDKEPPMLIQVPLAGGGFETAPLGRIQPLGWEGGFIETVIVREPKLILKGEIRRKHEPEVKRIISRTREILKAQSIYKGQAVRLDLTFMYDDDHRFHPMNDAPQFWDVDGVEESMLILSQAVEHQLASNIYLLVERTKECERNNIPLKHGCLLMGPYGTGKTMAARVVAAKCVRHGWTFIYLKNAEHLAGALRLAEMYSPAVVFTEDIDQAVSGDRDEGLNEILNTLDGVDTKGKPVITILTSNHPENISPAFLRAGRIDTIIHMTAPDAPTAERFVRLYAVDDDNQSLLQPGIELKGVGEVMAGFMPAFIAEAVQKSKRYAIRREGMDIRGKITADDLIGAGLALKQHFDMVNENKALTPEEEAMKTIQNFGTLVHGNTAVPHSFTKT
jgi:transitional endoplasmic reticulum ATPase